MSEQVSSEVCRWSVSYGGGQDFHGFPLGWTVTAPDGEAHYGWSEHNAKAIVEAFALLDSLVAKPVCARCGKPWPAGPSCDGDCRRLAYFPTNPKENE